jgi:outer membrane receptor protein involved in Fe transport
MRRARGLEVAPLVLAAALAASALLVAALGLRRRPRPSGAEALVAGVTSTEAARATRRAVVRAGRDRLRHGADAAVAAADALGNRSASSRRRRR